MSHFWFTPPRLVDSVTEVHSTALAVQHLV